MSVVLGISAYFHDSAACLVIDGQLVAAIQEERLSRVKNDSRFPLLAVQACLDQANLSVGDVDFVGFFEKPLLKFERILETHLAVAPWGLSHFLASMPVWISQKMRMKSQLRRELTGFQRRIVFAEHHLSHAASAFFPSPFENSAIITIDGVGEWATTAWGIGQGSQIEMKQELRFPHSLGLLYSAVTAYCGFRVNYDEYKLMGLAGFGVPQYADLIRNELLEVFADGSYRLNLRYFDFCRRLAMTNAAFHRLFGREPRKPADPIEQLDRDLAASVQVVLEDRLLAMARHVRSQSGLQDVCLAGGVALNCVANGRLAREKIFERIWIQPAAGDAGGALGVATWIAHQLLGETRGVSATSTISPAAQDHQRGSRLGPSYSNADIESALLAAGCKYQRTETLEELTAVAAQMLADGKVLGWFQGRMEFGPRALGGRSILADPRGEGTQEHINRRIKNRESFRPFAPAVLAEHAEQYFDLPANCPSPYMLLAVPAVDEAVVPPAVCHVDGSSRVQTVGSDEDERFRQLLEAFYSLTGCPMLVNTSFNGADEPIVCSPAEAIDCFRSIGLDALVIGDFVVPSESRDTLHVN